MWIRSLEIARRSAFVVVLSIWVALEAGQDCMFTYVQIASEWWKGLRWVKESGLFS